MGLGAIAGETVSLSLPQNSDSAQQQKILDALPVLVFLERAGRIVFANADARQLLGLTEGEWIPRPVEEVLWGLSPGTAEPQTPLTGTTQGSPFHATMVAADGSELPVEGTYCSLNVELREAVIVAHSAAREQLPRSQVLEDVLASLPEAVVIIHNGHVLYTNAAFTLMFGYTADEVSGGNLSELIAPGTRQSEHAMLEKEVDQGGRAAIETVRINKSGKLVNVAILASPLVVDSARVGYVLSFRDIGDRKQPETRLQSDSLRDVLTGLPNRVLFLDRLGLALTRRSRRLDQTFGVLLLDIDRLRNINDSLGHAAGDALLVAVAERLRAALRPQDSAARLGEDEFAILVENILNVSDLDVVASRLLREMERPFEILEHVVQAGVSVGAALAAADHTSPELLLRDAEFAVYSAKQEGGTRYEIFNKHLDVRFTSQRERERALRHVLEKRQFEIWYQPIYRLRDGRLDIFESLLRWRRADGSIDSFRDLLPVAEDTGLAISLGRETLEAVCKQLRILTDELRHAYINLTVNVTRRQFYHLDMVAQLKAVLAVTGVDPSRLLFEVAESTLNENPDAAVAILQRMVDCKVRIAVDNFGSKLAPLNHLARLPIDVMKLDHRLTMAATTAGRQLAVLESLIHLGHALGIQVVAQGIETPAQLHALCRMGCELGQGHLLSRALNPAEAFNLAGQGHWMTAQGS